VTRPIAPRVTPVAITGAGVVTAIGQDDAQAAIKPLLGVPDDLAVIDIMLFGVPETRDATGSGGIDPEGAAQSTGTNNGATAIDQGVIPPLTRFLVTFNFSW